MNKEAFVKLNKDIGHDIITINNISWIVRKDKTCVPVLSLEKYKIDKTYVELLFSKTKIKVINFVTSSNLKSNSAEYVFCGERYTIENFSSKVRNQIRKGLKSLVVKRPQLNDLVVDGLRIDHLTLEKHKRYVDFLSDKVVWEKYISILYEKEDVTPLGAYYEGKLVGYILYMKVEEKYYIYHPFIDRNYSALCPMNILLYTFITNVIDKEGKIEISYGLESVHKMTSLDHFKKGMLFSMVPVSRLTLINPQFNWLLFNVFSQNIVCLLSKIKFLREYTSKYNLLMDSYREFYKM